MEHCPSDPALRRRCFIGATLGAVLLMIVTLGVFLVSSREGRCELSRMMPNVEALLKGTKNVPSAGNKDLANMIGYLFVYGEGFLPLVLTKFDRSKDKLIFNSKCATFFWFYQLVSNETRIDLTGVDLQLDEQVKDGLKCEISQPSRTIIPVASMFSCRKPMSFACRSRDSAGYMRLVAELVLESLEFELNGDPKAMREGHFDKPPLDYSCNLVP